MKIVNTAGGVLGAAAPGPASHRDVDRCLAPLLGTSLD
jgi:hypothetical protein